MNYVLEHNHDPKSVFSFAKENNFEEADYYKHFGNFEALKDQVFLAFFNNTLEVLAKSEEYENFDARNQLLSFYFTFFEVLTANRSYVTYALAPQKNNLKNLKSLKHLREEFKKYINNLDIETLDVKEKRIEEFQQKTIKESAWIQLLLTLKFWLDDISPSFEKTDLFIEKSVNASFDVLNIAPLKSIIDLGKFIFKEKIKPLA